MPSMSFFGGKRDGVTAFAIFDAASERAISKMADQARFDSPDGGGLASSSSSRLCQWGSVTCRMLWTVEKAECRADRTVEERALGTYTGQDADTHQHGEQMLRQADCWSGTRDRPIGLTLFHASQEE